MPLSAAELAEEVRESNRRLTEAIQQMSKEFALFRIDVSSDLREIKSDLRWMKRIGGILVALVIGGLGFSYGAVRQATRLEDAVVALQQDSSQMKGAVVALTGRVANIENSLTAIQKDFAEMRTDLAGLKKDTVEMRANVKDQAGQSVKVLESLNRIEKTLAQTRPSKPAPE